MFVFSMLITIATYVHVALISLIYCKDQLIVG